MVFSIDCHMHVLDMCKAYPPAFSILNPLQIVFTIIDTQFLVYIWYGTLQCGGSSIALCARAYLHGYWFQCALLYTQSCPLLWCGSVGKVTLQ